MVKEPSPLVIPGLHNGAHSHPPPLRESGHMVKFPSASVKRIQTESRHNTYGRV